MEPYHDRESSNSRFKTQISNSRAQDTRNYGVDELLSIVRQATTEIIGHSVADDSPLMANGLDSLSAVVLAQALSQKLRLSLGSIFTLNYPTIQAMAQELNSLRRK